jgi:Predicted transcriptional regulators
MSNKRKGMLLIILDYKDRRPIYEQIVDRYKEMILKGILEPDSQLPSVRTLAMELSINPNTIQRAYAELEHQGFTYSVKGKGSFITLSESLLQQKKKEIAMGIDKLVKEAKILKITEEQFIEMVRTWYKEEYKND